MSKQRKQQRLRGEELKRYRESHYQAWQESGLTQQAYCEMHNISESLFKNRRRWQHDTSLQTPGFVPLTVKEETPVVKAEPLHVILPGDVAILIKEGFNAPLLRQVIKALRS